MPDAMDALRKRSSLTSLLPLIQIDLEPELTPAEREIVKGYDGWTNFCLSYGLKPFKDDDAKEGKQILEAMVAQDQTRS
jgi:hypothetical protein